MDSVTAQVTPLELTEILIERSGAQVLIGSVERLLWENSQVIGVEISDYGPLYCDKVVLAMGPWTGVYVEDWFGLSCPMEGIKSTSMVYLPTDDNRMLVEPFACFCDEDQNNCHLEIYPRPNGEVYVCGIGGSDHISGDQLRPGGPYDSSDKIHENETRINAARSSLNEMTTNLTLDRTPDIVQACMRPLPADGLPLIGVVPDQHEKVYVCAGHNCWGILWAPISGLAISELIVDGVCNSIDLRPFRVDRFGPSRTKKSQEKYGRKKETQEVGEQWSSTT